MRKLLLYHIPLNTFLFYNAGTTSIGVALLSVQVHKYRGDSEICVQFFHVCLGHILKDMPSKSMTANTQLT